MKTRLEHITWEEFFEKKLAFLYQDEKKSGEESIFLKLINRDNTDSR